MTIFAVVSSTPTSAEQLHAAVEKIYKDEFQRIGTQNWLVSDKATAREVSDKLGISNGENGSGFVFAVGGYFGRANPDIWAWMKVKLEKVSDAG